MCGSLPTVCFLTQAYPDSFGAYRGIFVKRLAELLARKGCHVLVVTPRIYNTSKRYEIMGGIPVSRFAFPSGQRPLISYQRIPILRMVVYMIACFFSSFTVIKRFQCNLIHVHWIHPNGIIGVFLKWFFHIPLVIHVRGSDFHTYATKNRAFTSLTRFILNRADWVICTSTATKNGLSKAFSTTSGTNISVVYNDVDATRFHPMPEEEARNSLGLDLNAIHLLFVGNLVKEKGVVDLMEALIPLFREKKTGDTFLHFVGVGPLIPHLRKMAREEKIEGHVLIHGEVQPELVPLWLNASNLLILPSEREGMPNIVLEAISCGVPVMATGVGDVPVFIRHNENGFLIEKEKRKDELRKYLEEILEKPDTLIAMKDTLQRKKATFPSTDKTSSVEEIMGIYNTLLKAYFDKQNA